MKKTILAGLLLAASLGLGYASVVEKYRGTESAPTAVVADDWLLRMVAQGYSGSRFLNAAAIWMDVDGTVAATAMPGRIRFMVTPTGAGGLLAEAMRITNQAYVGIGLTNPSYPLDVAGAANVSGALTVGSFSTGGLLTVGSLNVQGNATLNAGATNTFTLNSGTLTYNGTNGLFLSTSTTSNTPTLFLTATTGRVGIGTTTPGSKFEVVGGSIAAAVDGQCFALPSYSFTGDLNTGLCSPAADTLNLATNGANRLTIGNTGLAVVAGSVTVPVDGQCFALPSYSFTGDTNTGLCSPAADTLNLATGGTARIHVGSGGLVGIGTTSPGYPLHVVGGVQFSSGVWMGANEYFRMSGNSSNIGLSYRTTGAQTGIDIYGDGAINATFGNGGMALGTYAGGATAIPLNKAIFSTGVGIGIAAPGSLLHVEGAAQFGSGANVSSFSATGALTIANTAGVTPFRVGTSTLVVNNGNVGIGTSAPADILHVASDAFEEVFFQTAVTSADSMELVGRKSRGTVASPTVVANADRLLTIHARGYDSNSFETAANIGFEVDAAPGDGDMAGRIVFRTSADGAASVTERMRIDNAGKVGIGEASPQQTLDLNGTAIMSSRQLYSSSFTSVGYLAVVSSETIVAGAVITANACGGTKVLYAAEALATSTTNTFTAPAVANTGCTMNVCATTLGGNLTLDNNANFKSAGGADVVLTTDDCIRVTQIGTVWVQVSALLAN